MSRAPSIAALLLCAAACNGEDLSVGNVQCINVRCDDRQPTEISSDPIASEVEVLEEPIVSEIAMLPCPIEACRYLGTDMLALERDDRREVLIAAFRLEEAIGVDGERMLWLGRYRDTGLVWEGEIPNVGLTDNLYYGFGLALARGNEAGSALVVLSDRTAGGDDHDRTLRVHRLNADDTFDPMFEDDDIGQVESAARIGDDLLVVSYEQDPGTVTPDRAEVSRYALDGELLWRRAMLDTQATERDQEGVVTSTLQVRVLEDERIAVLVSRLRDHELLLLDGDGEEIFRMLAPRSNDTLPTIGAQLAVGANGDLVLGVDGYVLWRVDASGDRPQAVAVERERLEYYYQSVNGLALDASGTVFIGTEEGPADERRDVLDRISSDFKYRESVRLEYDGERCTPLLHPRTKLDVSADGRTVALLSFGCFASFDWPSSSTD